MSYGVFKYIQDILSERGYFENHSEYNCMSVISLTQFYSYETPIMPIKFTTTGGVAEIMSGIYDKEMMFKGVYENCVWRTMAKATLPIAYYCIEDIINEIKEKYGDTLDGKFVYKANITKEGISDICFVDYDPNLSVMYERIIEDAVKKDLEN